MDKYKKHVYCEMNFLKEQLSKKEVDTFNMSNEVEMELWIAIKKMLLSPHINLRLDISGEEYSREIQEAEKRRKRAARNGRDISPYDNFICKMDAQRIDNKMSIKCLGNRFPKFDSTEFVDAELLDGIYLTLADEDTCNEMMDKYGFMVVCPDNFIKLANVLSDTGVAVKNGGTYSWKKILEKKTRPCNSIVLVDNYAISDTEYLDENVLEILEVLLPQTSMCSIHFSIFTTLENNVKCSSRYDRIKSSICNMRPNLDIRFSIYKCAGKPFHDRTIMTNNEWIGCGGGFDLIKSHTAKKATTINVIYPFLNKNIEWASEAYVNLVEEVSKQHESLVSEPNASESNYFCWGDRGNRLIDTIL